MADGFLDSFLVVSDESISISDEGINDCLEILYPFGSFIFWGIKRSTFTKGDIFGVDELYVKVFFVVVAKGVVVFELLDYFFDGILHYS